MIGKLDINRVTKYNDDGTQVECVDIFMYSDKKNVCVRGRVTLPDFTKAIMGDIGIPIEFTDFKE